MLDVGAAKEAIAAFKREHASLDPPQYAAHEILGSRRADLASGIGLPHVDAAARARPFAVWDFRNGNNANFLTDSKIWEDSSWARLTIDENLNSDFHRHDQVVFLYFWQNDSGRDVVVNVQTLLQIQGFCRIWADRGFIRTPFWGGGTNGRIRLKVTAELELMEWWNQPPTAAAKHPSGFHLARDESISGGFLFATSKDIEIGSETYYLHHDGLNVPVSGVVLAEVSLNFYYSGYDGGFAYDYLSEHQNHSTYCPYVHVEVT